MNSVFFDTSKIAVVIPCYKVKSHILSVIENIDDRIEKIYVVDDLCPENSGQFVIDNTTDSRVSVLFHQENKGVGGAMISGYIKAIQDNMKIIVKLDGDGQMDPQLIFDFVYPILNGDADYTKGNRFFNLDNINQMPFIRIMGNSILSFMTKFSSGYWDIFDPTNGYTAIHSDVLKQIPLSKISNRYFFESDLLFRLNIYRAVVMDIPMDAKYGDEKSNLRISKVIGEFFLKNVKNSLKRILYNYYLRDMSVASIELPLGLVFLIGGVIKGGLVCYESISQGIIATSGTVMLSVLPILFGLQLLLSFTNFDINSTPKKVVHVRKIHQKSR